MLPIFFVRIKSGDWAKKVDIEVGLKRRVDFGVLNTKLYNQSDLSLFGGVNINKYEFSTHGTSHDYIRRHSGMRWFFTFNTPWTPSQQ
jgi:hypothetical protein